MGSASSYFLASLGTNNACHKPAAVKKRGKSTDDKNVFKYFMQELRKYMKKRRPHMLTKEVTVLGTMMWKDFESGQKQIFYDELCKKERQREDRKKTSSKFSSVTTLLSQPIQGTRKPLAIVQDSWNIDDQRTQFVPSLLFYSRRKCEESQSNGIKQDSCNLDHQAGPSTSSSNASNIVPRRRYQNTTETKSKRSTRKVRTNKRKRPSTLKHRNPKMYKILKSEVKRYLKINDYVQNTKSRYGFMWRKTKRRSIVQNQQHTCMRRSTRLMQKSSDNEVALNNSGDSCSEDGCSVLMTPHTPQSRNASQQSVPYNEDDSYSEESNLDSGGTSTTQSSIE